MLRFRQVRKFATDSKRLSALTSSFSGRASLATGAAIGAAIGGYGVWLQSKRAFADEKKPEQKMIYNRLGDTGIRVSAISYGAWATFGIQISEAEAEKIMKTCFDNGINYFDNAEGYASGKAEELMGSILKKLAWKRNTYVISTKIFWGGTGINDVGLSRKHIVEGLNNCLKRLQLDYVDIVFAHRPDPHVPMEEIVRAFNHVIDQGKAFYWGTSEWSAEQIQQAIAVADKLHLIPPQVEQPQYNLLHRDRFEKEYATLFRERKLGSTIWSPLASGILSGKYNKGFPPGSRLDTPQHAWLKDQFMSGSRHGSWEDIIANVGKLEPIAKKIGASQAQLAIAWTLKNSNVSTVLCGASKPEQIVENIKSLDFVSKLTPEIMTEIDGVFKNKPQKEKDWTGRT